MSYTLAKNYFRPHSQPVVDESIKFKSGGSSIKRWSPRVDERKNEALPLFQFPVSKVLNFPK